MAVSDVGKQGVVRFGDKKKVRLYRTTTEI